MAGVTDGASEPLQVSIDQDRCTGDGLCVQYAREIFELDVDGLAYVKDASGALQPAPGARVDVPAQLRLDVLEAAGDCPGQCIYVHPASSGPAGQTVPASQTPASQTPASQTVPASRAVSAG